jgi:uncharacterized protein YabN with tetrapyrrole methylase and pyrophosphatase domain
VLAKVREELEEVEHEIQTGQPAAAREEVGDLLFAVVNLARHLDGDAEQLLQDASRKFTRSFAGVEKEVTRSGRDWPQWTLEELDDLWNRVKAAANADS